MIPAVPLIIAKNRGDSMLLFHPDFGRCECNIAQRKMADILDGGWEDAIHGIREQRGVFLCAFEIDYDVDEDDEPGVRMMDYAPLLELSGHICFSSKTSTVFVQQLFDDFVKSGLKEEADAILDFVEGSTD